MTAVTVAPAGVASATGLLTPVITATATTHLAAIGAAPARARGGTPVIHIHIAAPARAAAPLARVGIVPGTGPVAAPCADLTAAGIALTAIWSRIWTAVARVAC